MTYARMMALAATLLVAACAQTVQSPQLTSPLPRLQTAGDLANLCRLDRFGNPVSPHFALCAVYLKAFMAGYRLRKEADERKVAVICVPRDEGWETTIPKVIPALENADKHMQSELARMNSDLASYGMQPITTAESLDEGVLLALNQLYACSPGPSVGYRQAPAYDYGPWSAMKR